MWDAWVLEENSIPYKLGTWKHRKDAEAALAETEKAMRKDIVQEVWLYVREHVNEA